MNKDLKDKKYTIPPLVLSVIQDNITRYPEDIDGTKRAKELLSGSVNYNQLKRILHDMKNFTKNGENGKYNLAGGKPFETWGWTILRNDRDFVQQNKKSREKTDERGGIIGRRNAHIRSHTKSDNFLTPPNALVSNSSNYTSLVKPTKLMEEIKRIKELML